MPHPAPCEIYGHICGVSSGCAGLTERKAKAWKGTVTLEVPACPRPVTPKVSRSPSATEKVQASLEHIRIVSQNHLTNQTNTSTKPVMFLLKNVMVCP